VPASSPAQLTKKTPWSAPLSPKSATNAAWSVDGASFDESAPRKRAAMSAASLPEKENLPTSNVAERVPSEWAFVEAAVHAVENALSPQRAASHSVSPAGSSPDALKVDDVAPQIAEASSAAAAMVPFQLPRSTTQVIVAIDNDECIGSWGTSLAPHGPHVLFRHDKARFYVSCMRCA
jgi:hypothetical protein